MNNETNASDGGERRLPAVASQSYLNARAVIAGDLYEEEKITRQECFRLEIDAAIGEDSGEVQFIKS